MRSPRVVTHLFADGGRIIKTLRTDYSEHVARGDLSRFVRQVMKTQHRAMFSSLRSGELDDLLIAACGPFPPPPVGLESGAHRVMEPIAPKQRSASGGVKGRSTPSPSRAATSKSPTSHPGGKKTDRKLPSLAPKRGDRASLSRPVSRYGSAPSKAARSIFGDGVTADPSLDDAILGYLAGDEKDPVE